MRILPNTMLRRLPSLTYRSRLRRNLLRRRLRADSGTVVEVQIMYSSRASMRTRQITTVTAFRYSTYLRLPRRRRVLIPAKNSCPGDAIDLHLPAFLAEALGAELC